MNGSHFLDLEDSKTLAELEGFYRGERVFILGDDPAVENAALDLIEDEFTFAINSFYECFDRLRWRPTFYVVAHSSLGAGTASEINALTGSWYFFDDNADGLRDGSDVMRFRTDSRTGEVTGLNLFAGSSLPPLDEASRSLVAAIQIAYHLGFEPVYLVSPAIVPDWGNEVTGHAAVEPRRRRHELGALADWHMQCRQMFEKAGREVFNLSAEQLPDVYRRADTYEVLASAALPSFERADHAHLDETAVIATIFTDDADRTRTMVDVGAHSGGSAKHFVDRNWTVYCFEPDPQNRQLLADRLGGRQNVTIDTRAISDVPAKDVPLFASPESTGISGLSAFRDTHELRDHVDVTTVGQVMAEYCISHIDFLKIDVEGLDFDVLKGVQWDGDLPDVIECEFEDAKTLPRGHSSRDMAEFLRRRGYAVYFSEWHPIIRYGIRHDWRRVVPYLGFDIPSNAWGNIVAFKEDPGYDSVQAAFGAQVKVGAPGGKAAGPALAEFKEGQGQDSGSSHTMTPDGVVQMAPGDGVRGPRWLADLADGLRSTGALQSTRALILLLLDLILFGSLIAGWGVAATAAISLTSTFAAIVGFNVLTVSILNSFDLSLDYLAARTRSVVFRPVGIVVYAASRLRYALSAAAVLGAGAAAVAIVFEVDPAIAFVVMTPLPMAVVSSIRAADRRNDLSSGPRYFLIRAARFGVAVWVLGGLAMLAVDRVFQDEGAWVQRFVAFLAFTLASVFLARASAKLKAVPNQRVVEETKDEEEAPPIPRDLGVRDLITVITPVRAGVHARDVAQIWQPTHDRDVDLENIRWVVVADVNDAAFGRHLAEALESRLAYDADQRRVEVVGIAQEGAGVKRNAGLEVSTTDFVGFVDADDRVDPDALRRALELALSVENAFGAVHSFPFVLDNGEKQLMRTPSVDAHSRLTHHHCARVYPRGLFTNFGLRYGPHSREDAIFLADLYELIPQVAHNDAKASFLTYVDHIDDSVRLTRVKNKNTSAYVRRLHDLSLWPAETVDGGTESADARQISKLFWNRAAYELAAGKSNRASIEEILQLARSRDDAVRSLDLESLRAQVEGISQRLGQDAAGQSLRRAILTLLATAHVLGRRDAAGDAIGARGEPGLGGFFPSGCDPILSLAIDLAGLRLRAVSETSSRRARRPLAVEVRVGEDGANRFRQFERHLVEHFLAGFPVVSQSTTAGVGDEMRVIVRQLESGDDSRTLLETRDPIADIDLHAQYASSRLLRLWGDVFPDHGPLESERAGAFVDALRVHGDWSVVRLYGTGPSAERLAQDSARCFEGLGIACNSMVRQPDLLDALNVRIVTAADAVFHAGPSPYSHQFRDDLTSWLRRREDHVFVTVGRDIHLYLRELPGDVHRQIVALSFTGRREDGRSSLGTIRSGTVRPHTNILTILMLPLAANIAHERIHLTGFDGAAPDEIKRYWHYSKTLNYSEELRQTVENYHPAFFDHDLPAYRASHSDMLGTMLAGVAESGLQVTSETESFIPALRSVQVRPDLH